MKNKKFTREDMFDRWQYSPAERADHIKQSDEKIERQLALFDSGKHPIQTGAKKNHKGGKR